MKTLSAVLVAGALALAACSSSVESGDDEANGSDGSSTTSPSIETTATSTSQPSTEQDSTARESGAGCIPATAAENEPGQQVAIQFEIEAAGNTYPIRLYVPGESASDAAGGGRAPAVLNWHGLGSDGFQQALLTNYEAVAEAEGFIVAHPTGGTDAGSAAGGVQAGWELAQFDIPGRDDLVMVEMLIDRLVTDYCADPNRIYSTGMSNGGFFTSRLVCDLADRIAAAVAVAGVTHPDDCRPTRPVPFMAFHGTADDIVPFDGGPSQLEGANAPPELRAFFDQVMPDELAEFAGDFGCASEPEIISISSEVSVYDYEGCADGVPIRFVEIDGGGHTWPGAFLGAFMTEALGPTTTDISATAEGWRFMSQFSLEG